MVDFLIRRSNPRGTAILFCLALVIELLFILVLGPRYAAAMGASVPPDMAVFSGYGETRATFNLMKETDGLSVYRGMEMLDIAFPLVYALAFTGLIALSLKMMGYAESKARFLILVPLCAGLLDYAENALVFASIAVHPGDFRILAAAAGTATAAKFLLFALSGLLALCAVVASIFRWRRPRAVSTVLAPKPIGPYSQAVKVGGFLFLSGQLGVDPESGDLAGPVRAQTERIMENISAILEAERLDTGDIVKTTIFLTDLADFGEVNEAYGASFVKAFPARSTVQVAALPKGAKVEIEAIARLR